MRQTMKEENILRYTLEELENIPDETDWERVNKMTDEEVEAAALSDPDAQPLTEAELNQFKRTIYVKGEKVWEDSKTIGELDLGTIQDFAIIPVEDDIVDWFKKQWEDYQARINSMLRDYVKTHDTLAADGLEVVISDETKGLTATTVSAIASKLVIFSL